MPDADKSRSSRRLGRTPPPKSRKPAMTESKASSESVFEVDRIRRLVELMKEHDLSEVDLRESRQRIRICRGPREAPRGAYGPPPLPPPPAASSAAAPPSVSKAATPDNPNIVLIKSPMVG